MRTNRKKSLAASLATASLVLFSFASQSAFAAEYFYWKPYKAPTSCHLILGLTAQINSFQISVDQCVGQWGIFACPSYPVPLPRHTRPNLESCIAAEAPALCNTIASNHGLACLGSRTPKSDCAKANRGKLAYNTSTLQQMQCVPRPVGGP